MHQTILTAVAFSQPVPGQSQTRMGDRDPAVVTAFCGFASRMLNLFPALLCDAAPAGGAPGITRPMPLLEVLVMVLARHLHVQDRDAAKVSE